MKKALSGIHRLIGRVNNELDNAEASIDNARDELSDLEKLLEESLCVDSGATVPVVLQDFDDHAERSRLMFRDILMR